MTATANTIDHVTFERLAEAGVVRGADVVGHPGGWGIVIKYGMTERVLAAKRGTVRTFRKFETLVEYLKGVGIHQFNVNTANFDATALKATRARPDSAERMKAAFEAAAHDDWVRAKVAASLADTRPNRTQEEVAARTQAVIDVGRKRHAQA